MASTSTNPFKVLLSQAENDQGETSPSTRKGDSEEEVVNMNTEEGDVKDIEEVT